MLKGRLRDEWVLNENRYIPASGSVCLLWFRKMRNEPKNERNSTITVNVIVEVPLKAY